MRQPANPIWLDGSRWVTWSWFVRAALAVCVAISTVCVLDFPVFAAEATAQKASGTAENSGKSVEEAAEGEEETARDAANPDEATEPVSAGTETTAATSTKFIRVRRTEDGAPVSMETSVVRYVSSPGEKDRKITVDLVAAVHVGEAGYYRKLNEIFAEYDALLYELVAPEGTRIPKGGEPGSQGHPVGALQNGMKSMLGLEHQLSAIDYTKKNFVHADMSPEEFAESMKERGESFTQIFFRMMGQAMAQQSQDPGGASDIKLLMAFFAKDRKLRLKRIMAEQFEDMEGSIQVLEGPDGSTLISERNKRALAVLADQIKAGKRRLGIFYGAGHLPDMERRLGEEFGLRKANVLWVEAWDLRK